MAYKSPELDIQIINTEAVNKIYIDFTFKGKFTTQASINGSEEWTSIMDQHPDKSIDFIWNCLDMTGFEIEARKEWYKSMQKYKKSIKKVYVVSDKIMIRSAAKVMLQFFGIPAGISRSLDELPESLLVNR